MMVAESWFRDLWASKKHGTESEELVLGVLAFEVASLMSKLVQLWQCLNDKQVTKLREEIAHSDGIKKLVSDDDEHIVRLICAEMLDNLGNIARAVARISKKCKDPLLRSFESSFNDLMTMGTDRYGWQFAWKKMDRKVKKMEKFIMVNSNLYQKMEMLSDLEQTLRKMRSQADMDCIALAGLEKNIAFKQQHEVKHLKQISLWNKTYDYTVQLLVGSVYTIFGKIGHVFGINNVAETNVKDSGVLGSDHIARSHSVAFMQSSVHPSESVTYRFFSGPLGNITTKSGLPLSRNNMNTSYSGPIQTSAMQGNPVTRRQSSVSFYSGPLSRSSPKTSPLNRANKSGRRIFQFWSHSSKSRRQSHRSKENQALSAGTVRSSMLGGSTSVNTDALLSGKLGKDVNLETIASANKMQDTLASCSYKTKRLHAPPDSLGAAALSLHYANLIIVIEKLAASPHLIGQDARDDLYNMLPASIRMALRAKLKPCAKTLSSSVYDTALAKEWNDAISTILEWLAPLAHNMIRWQTERSIEHQNFGFRTNVLLVQTLYFANQEKIEAIITELLVGLNYVWRFGREIDAKAIAGCSSGITVDDYFEE